MNAHRIAHPTEIIGPAAARTGWRDYTVLAVLCDFLHSEFVGATEAGQAPNPDLFRRFREYIAVREEEEADTMAEETADNPA